MKLLISLLLILLPAESFTRFTYCREASRGLYELQCVDLGPDGKGSVRLKRQNAEVASVDILLSDSARERFLGIISATNNLEQADSYESGKKVADLGRKRLTLEMAGGLKREADFNYSIRKEVLDLVSFFEALTYQETVVTDADRALQFDRLSIPKLVERIEADLKTNRLGDPERLVPMLEKIQGDPRLINFARAKAGRLKEQIVGKKTP